VRRRDLDRERCECVRHVATLALRERILDQAV
jgi:hypothetical protein